MSRMSNLLAIEVSPVVEFNVKLFVDPVPSIAMNKYVPAALPSDEGSMNESLYSDM